LPWCKNTNPDSIIIQNAAEHNLKSVDVTIPRHRLTVVTGVSGSGKSSLVFDTLYREGERRYLESFSAYARHFLGKLTRPAVGHIHGLSPTIAIDQRRVVRHPRSTVGTMTELYDYLRLLFARLGQFQSSEPNPSSESFNPQDPPKLERRLFSFNSPVGACPLCKGLGVTDGVAPDLLIADPYKTLRQGALILTTPNGYIIYSQVTMDVLNQVCQAHGFSVDIPWQELTPEQQRIVLYGSDIIKIPYGKHPLESRLKWSGITPKPREEGYYKGIIPVIENILKVDRNPNVLRFARSKPCTACHGTRLNPQALAVRFQNVSIATLAAQTIQQLHDFFTPLTFPPAQVSVGQPLRETILQRTSLLIKLGLGYLTLDRESTTLSGGEAQRIRLSTQIGTGLRGILYTLDEPSIGLHQRDNQRLLEMLCQLRDNGNTVVVVEHDEQTMRHADCLMDIGPAAGIHGGQILFNGPLQELLSPQATTTWPLLSQSRTRAFLTGSETIPVPPQRRTGSGRFLSLQGATLHNLKAIDVSFPLGVFNVVTGVSGAGKSTLVHHILANAISHTLHRTHTPLENCLTIEGVEYIDKIIEIDQAPIGRTPRSNPATYTKLMDLFRDLFAALPLAVERKWPKGRFSFNVSGGRCESCEGAGLQQIGMHFLGNVAVVCDQCGGKRFNETTLEVEYRGKSIFAVLEMSIEEAAPFFSHIPSIHRILNVLLDLGLGYIALGQSSVTLSGGEAQRVKLAAELCRPATGKTLYILDEPTTGLHSADIKILLTALNSLIDKGNTVIVVEHHPDLIKTADWVIDLGPESGENGGQLVAAGTPETVALVNHSFTGAMLREIFSPKKQGFSTQPQTPPYLVDPDSPIRLIGVSTHNLKHIDVTFPVNQLTVITGVSGSGKSSLAFDTLVAEGQQRFLSRFSTYARSMIGQTPGSDKELESCFGLMPTIAISQKTATTNPRSTVGTMTEILDFYRLLFARVGQPFCPLCRIPLIGGNCPDCHFSGQKTLSASMFSFNHHLGACPQCKGLGTTTVCDPQKLITHPHLSLLNGAMDGSKTGKFYGDPYGQHVAILLAVGRETGIDFSVPWDTLSPSAQHLAMTGTGDNVYPVIWSFKRKTREGQHSFQSTWLGFVNYVNQEYERKHADHRGEAMLPLMSDLPCLLCKGSRLQTEFLAVYFARLNMPQLCAKTVAESIAFFEALDIIDPNQDPLLLSQRDRLVSSQLRQEISRRLCFLQDVGLDYLSLDRQADTLSGGEAQRIRLAGQLGSGLTQVIYVLDEPTIGLHARDTARLLSVLKGLRDMGNTIVVVEHDADIISAADHIIDLGPGAGLAGGTITAQGTGAEIKANPASKTGYYLKKTRVFQPSQSRTLAPGIEITGAYANNLAHINLSIPSAGLIAVTGVSGCGKTSLVFDVIAASAQMGKAQGCKSITGLERFDRIITIDQKGIGTTPASTPATYTGIFDTIRQWFADTQEARQRGYKKNRFSFNVKGGRCEVCGGMGKIRTAMDFLADVWDVCEECSGQRYHAETLLCKLEGQSIADVLSMTVQQALEFFSPQPNSATVCNTLRLIVEVGLGYLTLGQAANTLSGGEAQRLKLVTPLLGGKTNRNLYLLDEPTTGLHFEDVERLLVLFRRLVEIGHTILVIEHHPDVIGSSDYIIDLGPDGGDRGGQVVAIGTPQQVSLIEASHTGKILKTLLPSK